LISVSGTRYVVDQEKGSDSNSGLNPSHAFKTIQHCVDQLITSDPGSECQIRAARYHEVLDINGIRGTTDKPIVIRGYEDEEAILDGTVPLQPSEWTLDSKTGICSAEIEDEIFALFLDDDLLTAARWPNSLWSDKTIFDNHYWGHCSQDSEPGNITDDGTADLASSGIDATGAMAILNIGSFNTYVRPVLYHKPGTNSFTYNHDMSNVHWKPKENQYYLEASLALLDNPGEWFFDKDTMMLYIIPTSGECPDPALTTLRGRTTEYGAIVTNCTGLTISDMTFFAANVHAHSIDRVESHVDDILLNSIQFKFPSHSKRMLGIKDFPLITKLFAKANMGHGEIVIGKLSVVNCTFVGGDGVPLEYEGEDFYIHNNLFAYNDWTCQAGEGGGTTSGAGKKETISRNTFWYNGNSAGIRPGNEATIEYNHMAGQCWGEIQNDGAAIQVQNAPQTGIQISHNWIHDTPKMAIRFDTPSDTGGGANMGHNGYQGYNVVWNTDGMMVKGDNHTVVNNIALDRDDGGCTLCVIYRLRHDPVIENNYTIVYNNGATEANGGVNVDEGGYWPVAGITDNNFSGQDVKTHMVDPDNLDFRPVEGGAFTEGDEIIGPYQIGLSSMEYWIPGRMFYKTSTPIPPNEATVASTRDAVMFLGGYMSDQHDFYFGIDKSLVESATFDDEAYQYSLASVEGNVFELPPLHKHTQYFWRVDVQRGVHIYKGDVWTFTTAN
ncbi:unnamed protein product, partial [Meganyctiphanes norvegica]